MFYILVRFTDKSGQYPVCYRQGPGKYEIDSKRFHENDNPGSLITGDKVGELVGNITRTYESIGNVKEIKVVRAD
jgi:hypothetical protein